MNSNRARKERTTRRSRRGALIIFLCFVMGLIVLPTIGLFSFECVRATVIREQLRSACQAASLAGAAKLASSDHLDPSTTHTEAIKAALETFRANGINEFPMNLASHVNNASDNPASNQSSVFIQFLNPNSTPANQPVSIGDTNGRIVHVVGAFGLEPAFGKFLGLGGPYTLRADGDGRVPQLDIVLCFDVSSSIDDQTPVTFVKRHWDSSANRIRHQITTARAGAPTTGGMASGRLYDIVGPQPTGTGLNATYPQSLATAANGDHSRPLSFSPTLRGSPNTGSYPGNYPSGSAGNQYTFTDLVVNINEKSDATLQVPFMSSGGFSYPNLETVVEAARGNLESPTTFSNAGLNTVTELSTITPRTGYQADYFASAKRKLRPIYDAQDAAQQFFTIMNTNTEANFGLVSFSTEAGNSPGETQFGNNISDNYTQGGSGNFPRPTIFLQTTQTNYNTILNVIPSTLAYGSTNIGDALLRAKNMLVAAHRPGARRAIVLFTDGQPTAGGSNPWTHARNIANEIKAEGIPIYTIGLAQNNQVIPGECNILNDDPNRPISYTDTSGNPQTYTPGPGNPGVSYIAGNKGKFFLVTNSANLRLTFENIARQLVQLVKVN